MQNAAFKAKQIIDKSGYLLEISESEVFSNYLFDLIFLDLILQQVPRLFATSYAPPP